MTTDPSNAGHDPSRPPSGAPQGPGRDVRPEASAPASASASAITVRETVPGTGFGSGVGPDPDEFGVTDNAADVFATHAVPATEPVVTGHASTAAPADPGSVRVPNPRVEFAIRSFLVVSFVAVCGIGLVRLHDRMLASPRSRTDLGRWSVGPAPGWFSTEDAREIREHTGLRGWTSSAADPEVGRVLRQALSEAPPVRRVVSLERNDDRTFDAWVELRRPAAAVRLPGAPERWVEVDEEGAVLGAPRATRPVREGRYLRAIVGAVSPIPAAGGRAGADVAAAAELSAALDETAGTPGSESLRLLDTIDVSNWGERKKPGASEVTLRISGAVAQPAASAAARPAPASRVTVEWGRLSHDPDEATFGAKTARLLRVLEAHPSLAGIDTVRVAFADAVVVPAAQAR